MKRGRSREATRYHMAWVLVLFDLPVDTAEARREAARFRTDLVKDGYVMVQYSVYARPCGSADRVSTHVRRLKGKIPPRGEVRGLIITDAQWGRMIVVRNEERVPAEEMPAQLLLF